MDSFLNGDGIRTVLWVSGCNHKCKGCQNPITWDENYGVEFDESATKELFNNLNKPHISGVTFSGGDPLFPGNRNTITQLAKQIKSIYPNKTIWLYTGYLWEEIKDLEVVKYLDVIVDGEFIEEQLDVKLHWKGSTNQRVIDVQDSIKLGKVVLHNS